MGIEGISLTTVFNLLLGGFALSTSLFLGAYYLRPAFSIDSVMASVAYDLATIYELAYTMPGDVEFFYYGPQACTWNEQQPGDTATSFHCFSSKAVVIKDVLVDKYNIYIHHDPYTVNDYVTGKTIVPTEVITQPRTNFGMVKIPFWNKQVCTEPGVGASDFEYCATAWAPFATNYKDLSFTYTDETPFSYEVEDYSFRAGKERKKGFYDSVYPEGEIGGYDELLLTLKDFALKLEEMYECGCSGGYCVSDNTTSEGYPLNYMGGEKVAETITGRKVTVHINRLRRGYRWHIYEDDSGEKNILCHERLSFDEWYFPDLKQDLECTWSNIQNYPDKYPIEDYDEYNFDDLGKYHINLPPSSEWRCYDYSSDSDYTRETDSYISVEDVYFKLGTYIPEYCFNIEELLLNQCSNVTDIKFADYFIELVNDNDTSIPSYVWYAGFPSSIDVNYYYNNDTKTVVVNGSYAKFNVVRGW